MARSKDDNFGLNVTESRTDDIAPSDKVDSERLACWKHEHQQHIVRFLARILASAITRVDRHQQKDSSA
jgi:hypothetical protein